MERDLKHLRILGTINYVFAGITALIFILPLIYLSMAFLMISLSSLSLGVSWYAHGTPDFDSLSGKEGPGFAIIIFPLIMGFAFGIPLLASTILSYYWGKSMRAQKNYIFCLVMAAISATSVPFGTVLGIFSLVVLLRESVKELFKGNKLEKVLWTKT